MKEKIAFFPCVEDNDLHPYLWRFGYSGDVAINNLSVYKFESILFDYGRYVFVSVFRKAQEEERYVKTIFCYICKFS